MIRNMVTWYVAQVFAARSRKDILRDPLAYHHLAISKASKFLSGQWGLIYYCQEIGKSSVLHRR